MSLADCQGSVNSPRLDSKKSAVRQFDRNCDSSNCTSSHIKICKKKASREHGLGDTNTRRGSLRSGQPQALKIVQTLELQSERVPLVGGFVRPVNRVGRQKSYLISKPIVYKIVAGHSECTILQTSFSPPSLNS